ncbi:unnamed protein product, partial [Dibothriocephalus latus]
MKTVLDLTRAYMGEDRSSVWSVLAQGLGHIRFILQEMAYKAGDEVVFSDPSPEEVGLNNLYTQLTLPVYEKLEMLQNAKLASNTEAQNRASSGSLLFVGFDPKPEDSNNDSLLRPIILDVLGRAGHPDVISRARKAFDAHYASVMETPEGQPQANLISPDLRTTIYSLCLRNGGAE